MKNGEERQVGGGIIKFGFSICKIWAIKAIKITCHIVYKYLYLYIIKQQAFGGGACVCHGHFGGGACVCVNTGSSPKNGTCPNKMSSP
jgi:hypothetical protein